MKWFHYVSLLDEAQAALDKGDGRHGQYIVDGTRLAVADENGEPKEWILIIRSASAPIVGVESDRE